jgi:hypothetical protein
MYVNVSKRVLNKRYEGKRLWGLSRVCVTFSWLFVAGFSSGAKWKRGAVNGSIVSNESLMLRFYACPGAHRLSKQSAAQQINEPTLTKERAIDAQSGDTKAQWQPRVELWFDLFDRQGLAGSSTTRIWGWQP